MILGSVASAGLAIITATRIAAAEVTGFFRLGTTASSGYNVAWSLALLGAGHLVGLSVGMAMLAGLIIAWAIAVPILTSMQPAAAGVTLAAHTTTIWRTQVRFIGAGAIAIAAIYTLAQAREAGRRRTREHARRVARRERPATIATAISRRRGSIALTAACLDHRGVARVHVRASRRCSRRAR